MKKNLLEVFFNLARSNISLAKIKKFFLDLKKPPFPNPKIFRPCSKFLTGGLQQDHRNKSKTRFIFYQKIIFARLV